MVLIQGIAALAAKIASASTVVQVTAGVGIAVAGVTGAGAAGMLPASVQEVVSPAGSPASSGDRLTGIDDGGEDAAETDDSGRDGADDGPGAGPTDVPGTDDGPAAPTPSPPGGVEPGDDGEVHQHRGGRTPTATPTTAVRTDNSGPGSANSGRHSSDDDSSGRDHPEDDGPETTTPGAPSSATHTEDPDDDSSGRDDSGRDDSDDDRDDDSGRGSGDDD